MQKKPGLLCRELSDFSSVPRCPSLTCHVSVLSAAVLNASLLQGQKEIKDRQCYQQSSLRHGWMTGAQGQPCLYSPLAFLIPFDCETFYLDLVFSTTRDVTVCVTCKKKNYEIKDILLKKSHPIRFLHKYQLTHLKIITGFSVLS